VRLLGGVLLVLASALLFVGAPVDSYGLALLPGAAVLFLWAHQRIMFPTVRRRRGGKYRALLVVDGVLSIACVLGVGLGLLDVAPTALMVGSFVALPFAVVLFALGWMGRVDAAVSKQDVSSVFSMIGSRR
jgi:hypothetical protein